MKILVIFTGGTIGCVEKDGWRDLESDAKYTLLKMYKEQFSHGDEEFDTLSPYSVLSEQLSSSELNMLLNAVEANISNGYDGIIITHGTDTLQYTAAALAYSFNKCPVPIVLVSAASPLNDKSTNGVVNFAGAVSFIRKNQCGVFVSYKNTLDKRVCIHTATRVLSHGECSSELYSIDGEAFAFCDPETQDTVLNKCYVTSEQTYGLGAFKYTPASRILLIHSHPADSYSYRLSDYGAVIFYPYHSGTLNTSSDALISFCRSAKEKNIPVFASSIYSSAGYVSTKAFDELGITPLPFCSLPAAYMKCWAAISRNESICRFVSSAIAQEFLPT